MGANHTGHIIEPQAQGILNREPELHCGPPIKGRQIAMVKSANAQVAHSPLRLPGQKSVPALLIKAVRRIRMVCA